jgi:N-acetylmuramoyl-L-alanine amidase
MGGTVETDRAGILVRIFNDSVRLRVHSPFFTAGGAVYQLAFDVDSIDGVVQVPEQFFIQFIPTHYARSVAYADNVLTVTQQSQSEAPRSPSDAPHPKRIVILDPGHGGVDPGAKGPNGLREKDATLLMAKRLAAVLLARGYEVHLTRTTDTLISLADRPRMANRWKGSEPGALYISIHNNSGVPAAHGFETYFLADASTDDERRVADMENAAIKYEKSTRPIGSELDQVLNGLRNDFYLKASNTFADVVQHDMAKFHPGPNRGVKRANFRVLIGALMPAVLVEVAFISNPREADLLGSSAFQDKVAYSLAQSVDAFFHDNEALWMKQ